MSPGGLVQAVPPPSPCKQNEVRQLAHLRPAWPHSRHAGRRPSQAQAVRRAGWPCDQGG